MKELVFVYNAGSSLFNTLTDFAHKIIAPSTYACRLCALTYSNFAMKKEWKDFIQRLPVVTVFLHKDEFEKEYHQSVELPVVFMNEKNALQLILSKNEIESCETLQQLEELLIHHLSLYDKHHYSHL